MKKIIIRKHKLLYPYPKFWLMVIAFVLLIWFLLSLPSPLFKTPYSTVIEDAEGNFLSARIAGDYQWRFPVSDSVPLKFRECIRMFEDEYFYQHPGVNPVSLFRAMKQNLQSGRVISGGSTLSMQVIRLSRGQKDRSVATKIQEMILAMRLELGYSKDEIMKLYAAHAPFGGNVVGLEAAAWRYFGRSAAQLSWGETAALAVLPNAPSNIFPGKNHDRYLKKRNKLLQKLYQKGIIDENSCLLAQAEPLPDKPHPLPRLAPHLLNKISKEGFQSHRIRTSIDLQMQQHAMKTAEKYIRYYAGNYIQNMAILVMETGTGKVRAYVGNVDLPGTDNAAYVDHVVAPRSSGSILKPFLFAAMIDEGVILPTSLISDIPSRFGSYKPENFEKTFQGMVPADEALARSLNIPAVRELDLYGTTKFHQILKDIGFSTIDKSADHYGLSLILGGAEVSLWETTAAYAGMGRYVSDFLKGTRNNSEAFNKISSHEEDLKQAYRQANIPGAAAWWFCLDALTNVNRPHGELGWEYFSSSRKIAWKTGTSVGSRDAWSVGVTPDYTVGVWVGNASGEGRPGLTGVTHAAPVMFEIFKALKSSGWYVMPVKDMQLIKVCKKSGFRATEHCEAVDKWVPKKGVRVKNCPFHKQIFLDKEAQFRVSASCYPVSEMKSTDWFVLPPAQEYYYRQHRPDYDLLPPFMPGCDEEDEVMLDILVPDNNTAIFIPKDIDGETGMVIFEAVHRKPDAILFWHLDENFVTQTQGMHKIEITPSVGNHVLTVQDEAGNTVRRKFRVK